MYRRTVSGQVTVFISLIMMCIFTFFCVLLESARTAGARWYLQAAASSAMDSVFSQYHRQLWDSYRLLFAEYDSKEELAADFADFLQPYLNTENWYPMEVSSVEAVELLRATEEDARYFEQSILDYMKYGVWNLDFNVSTAQDLWDSAREAGAVNEVAEAYRGHTREVLRLEKSLKAISESLDRQQDMRQKGLEELHNYDGSGFCRTAKKLIDELRRMPDLVENYRKRADTLARGLDSSSRECSTKLELCSQQMQQLLEDEIREYEAYVREDGERRQEIETLESESKEQIHLVEEAVRRAREVEEMIDEWESDNNEGSELDLDELWGSVEHDFACLSIRGLSFDGGVGDEEKEGWLNQVESMCGAGLLELVIPPGTMVSEACADLKEAPSQIKTPLEGDREIKFFDHLLVDEYCGSFFRHFGMENQDGVRLSGSEKTVLDYEIEYLIAGEDTDRENLSGAVYRLLAIREGMNLAHILTDSAKRAEARSLAMVITGAAALTPLLMVTSFLIMSIWALGEALMDVKGLLAGQKVPLVKSKGDWQLSLDGLLAAGQSGSVERGGGERGFSYLSWLKILLFMGRIVPQEYRMMDLIQMNLRMEQPSYRMRRCVYQAKIAGRITGKHVFFSLGFVQRFTGGQEHSYPMEVNVERAY